MTLYFFPYMKDITPATLNATMHIKYIVSFCNNDK